MLRLLPHLMLRQGCIVSLVIVGICCQIFSVKIQLTAAWKGVCFVVIYIRVFVSYY